MLKPAATVTTVTPTVDQTAINAAVDLLLSSPKTMAPEQKYAAGEAIYQKGRRYQFGLDGTPVDLKQAKACYKLGVKLDHVDSMTALGVSNYYYYRPKKTSYYNCSVFDPSAKYAIRHSKAISLFVAAAKKNSIEAMHHIGMLLSNYTHLSSRGESGGVYGSSSCDLPTAITWFQAAIKRGYVYSMIALADLYIARPRHDNEKMAGPLYRAAFFNLPADGSFVVTPGSNTKGINRQYVLDKMKGLPGSPMNQYHQLTADATFPVSEFMQRAQQEPALYFSFVCDDTLPTLALLDARLQAKFTLCALEKTLAESVLLRAAVNIGKLFKPGKTHAVRQLKDFLTECKITGAYMELIRSDRPNNIHASNYEVFSFLHNLLIHIKAALKQLNEDKSDEPLKNSLQLVETKLEKIKVLLQQQLQNEQPLTPEAGADPATGLKPPPAPVGRSMLWSQVDPGQPVTENPELPADAPGCEL
jgi:TPR repeat protein